MFLGTYVRYTRALPKPQIQDSKRSSFTWLTAKATAANPKRRRNAPPPKRKNPRPKPPKLETRRHQDRRRREEPGPDRRRGRCRLPRRRRPHRQRPGHRAGRALDRPQQAEKQIKCYRSTLRKSLKRTERRGSTARRKATTEARKTRNQVEREARNRRREVETTMKRNRNEVEQRVRKAIDEQTSRAQGVVGTAGPRRQRQWPARRAALELAALPSSTGDGHRPRGAWLIGPALAAFYVGAELEADAAAVVVAEAVGVAEAAAAVGLDRAELAPAGARDSGTAARPVGRRRPSRSRARDPAAEDDRPPADRRRRRRRAAGRPSGRREWARAGRPGERRGCRRSRRRRRGSALPRGAVEKAAAPSARCEARRRPASRHGTRGEVSTRSPAARPGRAADAPQSPAGGGRRTSRHRQRDPRLQRVDQNHPPPWARWFRSPGLPAASKPVARNSYLPGG